MADLRDPIIKRMVERAILLGQDPNDVVGETEATPAPKYSLSSRWITFECGCTCERATELFGAEPFDPVIFRDLPEQAVYEKVCAWHNPKMNEYVRFGGFVDFDQWYRNRRNQLLGRVR